MEKSAADWLAEGNAHYDAQRWDDAGRAIEAALALLPGYTAEHARAWYRLGNVREEQGLDDAASGCFAKAVDLDPAHAQAWNNYGAALQRLGKMQPAITAYRRAIAADPDLPQPVHNLGYLYASEGNYASAAECFRAALQRHPGDPTFEYLLAAACGKNPERAPQGYVVSLFDSLAPQFDRHLLRDLDYRAPEGLATLVRPTLEAAARDGRSAQVVDLGCGTGLVGSALAGTGAEVVGVDLSPRMLDVAAGRGVYARLERGELVDVLARVTAASVLAVLAADVFIYVGNLDAVFDAVSAALAPGGVFGFSVEATGDKAGYRLKPTGRYAHSLDYLYALAAKAGLEKRRLQRCRIRREGRGYAEGWLALFGKKPTY
jgi:predicted TPR repeat methyltransferase